MIKSCFEIPVRIRIWCFCVQVRCRRCLITSNRKRMDEKRVAIAQTNSVICNIGNPLHFSSKFLAVGGKHFIIIEVFNKCNQTIEIWDVHMAHVSNTKNIVNLECSPKIGLFSGKLIVLKPIERYNIFLEMEIAPHSFVYPKELQLQMVMEWRFGHNTLVQNTVIYQLPKLSIKQPSFLLEATSCLSAHAGEMFTVNYRIVNNLQDFIVELQWSPDRITTAKGVICHQPRTVLAYFKQGSSITLGRTFTVFQEGFVELSEHMKVALHYQDETEQKELEDLCRKRWAFKAPAHISPIICDVDSEEDCVMPSEVDKRFLDQRRHSVKAITLHMQRLFGRTCQLYISGTRSLPMKYTFTNR